MDNIEIETWKYLVLYTSSRVIHIVELFALFLSQWKYDEKKNVDKIKSYI